MRDIQLLIDTIVGDIKNAEKDFESARRDRSHGRMDAARQQQLGMKIILGRALALLVGVEGETEMGALHRANRYLNH